MIKFNLKKVMKEKKMTLKELSSDTGLSINTLSLLSTGKSKGIQFDTLEKLMQSLKCNVKDLIILDDGFRKLNIIDISVNNYGLFVFSKPDDNRIYNVSCTYSNDEDEARELLQQAIDERVEELAKEKYFMTYNELSKYLNLSKPTIDDLLIKNGMKYFRVGSTYRFKKSDVDDFMDHITSQMDITNNDLKSLKKVNTI